TTQSRFAGKPLIQITGGGLSIVEGSSTVRGLTLPWFRMFRSVFSVNSGNNIIEGNFIGTDPTGAAIAHGGDGTYIRGRHNKKISAAAVPARNVLSSHQSGGVRAYDSRTSIEGNFIGTDLSGGYAVPNSGGGVVLEGFSGEGPPDVTIRRNIISGNGADGLGAGYSSNLVVQGNYIGTD